MYAYRKSTNTLFGEKVNFGEISQNDRNLAGIPVKFLSTRNGTGRWHGGGEMFRVVYRIGARYVGVGYKLPAACCDTGSAPQLG